MNHKDTLDRSPFGHKTLFTFAKTAGQKLTANQCRMIGIENRLTPDPFSMSREPPWRTGVSLVSCLKTGGGGRDRTDDLKLAKLALSQLSYAPGFIGSPVQLENGGPGKT